VIDNKAKTTLQRLLSQNKPRREIKGQRVLLHMNPRWKTLNLKDYFAIRFCKPEEFCPHFSSD
jgi:hypothetical protein